MKQTERTYAWKGSNMILKTSLKPNQTITLKETKQNAP
jgi:hypothetical protein